MPDFLRTSTFRLAAGFAVLFSLSVILLFAFIYWQTSVYETVRIDRFLVDDASLIASQPEQEIYQAVTQRNLGDLHRVSYAAIFDVNGDLLVGNLPALPPNLPIDGKAHALTRLLITDDPFEGGDARIVARPLPDGDVLIVARNVDALRALGRSVRRALQLGVIPALLLSIAAGAFVSWRVQQRVQSVHRSAERILIGHLRERLPVRGTDDDFDRLARNVNLMLDEIGRLLDNVRSAGNDIARDLRAPLARLRDRLERAKETVTDTESLRQSVDDAVAELDRNIATITTLLRIGAIEAGRPGGGERIDLAALVDEVAQIYQPLAEDAGVSLATETAMELYIFADRGLMVEALANLVQNAIKFTPEGGRVRVTAAATAEGPAISVSDSGPGIPAADRDRVFERFYRLDPTRDDGSGLGLSLVAAIVKSHGYRITVASASPGSVFTIMCRPAPALTPA